MSSFMQPQLDRCDYWEIETKCGDKIVPASVQDPIPYTFVTGELAQEIFGDFLNEFEALNAQRKHGYIWRLSAPGYLDCTEWTPVDSPTDAAQDLMAIYGDEFDLDDLQIVTKWLESFDYFWSGYLTALAFTGTLGDDKGTPIFDNPGGHIRDVIDMDIFETELRGDDAEGYKRILGDCVTFYCEAEKLIGEEGPKFESAGMDFHFTRNGHGCGFWNGDWPVSDDKLSEMSRPYGSCEVELSGGHGDQDNTYKIMQG